MRLQKRLFLLFLLVALSTRYQIHASDDGEVDATSGDSEDDLVQRNPDYVNHTDTSPSEGEQDGKDESDYSDSETEEDLEAAKTALSKALKTSRKVPRRAFKLMKKKRNEITVVLIMYAFRREIYRLLLHFFGTSQVDPKTGEVVGRGMKIPLTTILKIVLFVDVMRRMQSMDGDSKKLPMASLLMGGSQSALFGQIVSTLLFKPSNPSYVPPIEQHYTFERVNERYTKDSLALKKALAPARPQFRIPKSVLGDSTSSVFGANSPATGTGERDVKYNGTVILFEMTGLGTSVVQMKELSDKVSFLLSQHRAKTMQSHSPISTRVSGESHEMAGVDPELEIIITLESPGGSASDYGLAAQQILRLRDEPGIKVTVCVDKVAASGGYMMACTSSPGRLYAAPFAVVGSIGVIGQTVNVHNTLENWGVKPLVFRGGKHKSPLGVIGEVTEDAIETVQNMVDKTHDAFKRHVLTARPRVAEHIDDVATGEVWLGCDALGVGLVDRVVTSDEYIGERLRDGARILKLVDFEKPRFPFVRPRQGGLYAFVTHTLPSYLTELRYITSKLSKVFNTFVTEEINELGLSRASRSLGVSDVRVNGMS